jgi:hypothetical protein
MAQGPVNTPHFTLSGNYQGAKKETNVVSGRNSYNYTIMSADNSEYYVIGVMNYKNDPAYLDEIKRSSTERYNKINFQGVPAISSEREIMSDGSLLYAKDIMFFKNSFFFSILLVAQNKNSRNSMFTKIQTNFKAK